MLTNYQTRDLESLIHPYTNAMSIKTTVAHFEEKGDEDVFRFFKNEITSRNIDFDEKEIRIMMNEEFQKAYDELKNNYIETSGELLSILEVYLLIAFYLKLHTSL